MTAASLTNTHFVGNDRWLFGPGRDLFLGCGVGYAVVLVAFLVGGNELKAWAPMGLLAFVLLFTSVPHYGATLMRVYNERESRRRYAVFSVWISLVLLVAFAVACHWYELGSGLFTVYLNWSPWHYAGQNYGIALMFLHRRGVEVTPTAKKWLYSSFVLAFLLAFVRLNGIEPDAGYAFESGNASAGTGDTVYRLLRLGIPEVPQKLMLIVGLAAYLVATGRAFKLLLDRGTARDMIPAVLIVASQSLWFVIPAMFRTFGVLENSVLYSPHNHQYAFLLIAIGHAVQYLWITTYFARKEPRFGGAPRHLAQCVLAGCVVWYLPRYLFDPSLLGSVSFNAGLALLIAAAVNIHHFILDGAVWKLRDGRVASVLLRTHSEIDEPAEVLPSNSWIRPIIWTLGTLLFAVTLVGNWEREFGVRRSALTMDTQRLQTALERLEAIGQDDGAGHRSLGNVALRLGRHDLALAEFQKSVALEPHPKPWFEMGKIYDNREQWSEAVLAYEAAYAIDSKPRKLIGRLAQALSKTNQHERSLAVLRAGAARHPDAPVLLEMLRHAETRAPDR